MWAKVLSLFTCCMSVNKVSPGEERTGDEPEDGTMVRETAEASSIPVSSPPVPVMSQPRPDRSSADILSQLRDEGVIPGLKRRDNGAVAFEVPTENPETPRYFQVRLEKMERRMEERRDKVKKSCPQSIGDLERKLRGAEVRRKELLAQKISANSAKKAAKKAARNMKSTAFVIISTSDSDVIATRESRRYKLMEKRLTERRERVAKKATRDALETRQNLATERRQDHVVATVSKAKDLARPHSSNRS
ncbi:uncharacterized protein LOC144869519 isoform X2 [Branchiostoma floridae x Branchiostoma japonicum]